MARLGGLETGKDLMAALNRPRPTARPTYLPRSSRGASRIAVLRATSWLGALGLLISGCGVAGGESDGRDPDALNQTTPAVEVVLAVRDALPLRERLTGTVLASGQVSIFPQVGGQIVAVLARNGDPVEPGQPLVRLRAQITESQLRQARANLEVARADLQSAEAALEELERRFQRTQDLAEQGLVSEEIVDTQRAELNAGRAATAQTTALVEQAEATVAERREMVDQMVVRSPIRGRVGQRNAEVGMQVSGQTALFTVGSLENMRVEVPVTQEMLAVLEPGQRVAIHAESMPDTAIEAEISRISPFLAEGSFSAEAEIDVPNRVGALLPGMFVTVDVFYGESEQATVVPRSALYDHPERGVGVYSAPSLELETPMPSSDNGTSPLTAPTPTRFHSIEVVAEGEHLVGIRGIDAGTWVVVMGQHLLSEQVGGDEPTARIRPVTSEHIVGLQRLQRQDFLQQFMQKQQRLAQERADSLDERGEPAESSSAGSN